MINRLNTHTGDRVKVNAQVNAWSSSGNHCTLRIDTVGTVTRVGRFKMLVRFNAADSIWVENIWLDHVNEISVTLEAPEGGIAIDDPRIDWIWRKIAAYASYRGYCDEFDSLCDDLGIPGREREFTVEHTIGGYAVRSRVTARSQVEADTKFKEALDARQ